LPGISRTKKELTLLSQIPHSHRIEQDRFELLELLYSDPDFAHSVLEIHKLNSFDDLLKAEKSWQKVVIKPKTQTNHSLLIVEKKNNQWIVWEPFQKYSLSDTEMEKLVNSQLKETFYLQQFITAQAINGEALAFSLIAQQGKNKGWLTPITRAAIAVEGPIASLKAGAEFIGAPLLIKEVPFLETYDKPGKHYNSELHKITLNICQKLEKLFANPPAAIGLKFAFDKDLKPKLLSINPRPKPQNRPGRHLEFYKFLSEFAISLCQSKDKTSSQEKNSKPTLTLPAHQLSVGFLHRGGMVQWSYALASDVAVQGGQLIRFTCEDIDFKTATIMGEIWENDSWIKKTCRFPDVIRNYELRNNKDIILKSIPYSLGPVVKKNEQLALFSRNPTIAKYIPETLDVDTDCPIIKKIQQWGAGLLKPSRGRLGQGIIFIKTDGNNFQINNDGKIDIVDTDKLKEFLKAFYPPNSRPYILQQFASGTALKDRYFNLRVVVLKSSDGDWHPCNFVMSLLAKKGSIIANRDVGARNININSLLKHKFPHQHKNIYHELFSACVAITRILDDSVNNTAEEIALDMAIDNNANIWLHEANWRGGIWLFEDDIGLYRHGGGNLRRIALQHLSGCSIDRANACNIAIAAREKLHLQLKQSSIENSQLGMTEDNPPTLNDIAYNGLTFGIEIVRYSIETAAMIAEAISSGLALLSVSSASSFRKAQRQTRYGIEAIDEQIPAANVPLLISRGGACIHDPFDSRSSQNWLKEELLLKDLIDSHDITCGFSISANFLKQTIQQNCKDLGVESLDVFVIEGLEYSLSQRKNWQEKWLNASLEMHQSIKQKRIKKWGFALNANTLGDRSKIDPKHLITLINNTDYTPPQVLIINIEHDFNFENFKSLSELISSLSIHCVFSLESQPLLKKQWDQKHHCVPHKLIKKITAHASSGQAILCPVISKKDIRETLECISHIDNIQLKQSSKLIFSEHKKPWFKTNLHSNTLTDDHMKNDLIQNTKKQPKTKHSNEQISAANKKMQALAAMASFDQRQFFRFFVDGRFQKKYQGWSGYEANEPGSVAGMLKAYCYILDNFDLSAGLKSSHVRNIHACCMKNVLTKNQKSAPGDLRYLEAGFNIYTHYSTINSIQEIIDRRQGDGTRIFNTPGFRKTSEELTAESVYASLKEKKKLKFRPWYPQLTIEQEEILNNPGELDKFYQVKHFIQRGFAVRTDQIVSEYNTEIKQASTEQEILIAISRVVRNLEMLHPFPDGNGRTFICVLMNHLLLYNGFLAAILYDPNIDIELSVEEFVEEIKVGISNTQKLLDDPEANLYNYSINESSEKDIKSFELLAKDLIIHLSPYADLTTATTSFHEHEHLATYLYLTPNRLTQLTKGNWLNANPNTLESLRFQSVQIDETISDQQLYFFRDLSKWTDKEKVLKPWEYIRTLMKKGVNAVVVDDIEVARNSPVPALYVEDVDRALGTAGRTVRKEINCRSIAITGTKGKTETKIIMHKLLKNQAQVHMEIANNNKTPHILTSLANLKLTDNLEINEIAIDIRPNPARYRFKSVAPNIALLTQFESAAFKNEEALQKGIQAYAAAVDGLQEGGIYLINSESDFLQELTDSMLETRDISIQTYGYKNDDIARIIEADLDKNNNCWNIKAEILGNTIQYSIPGQSDYLPVASIGILLTIANLGYDMNLAANQLSKI